MGCATPLCWARARFPRTSLSPRCNPAGPPGGRRRGWHGTVGAAGRAAPNWGGFGTRAGFHRPSVCSLPGSRDHSRSEFFRFPDLFRPANRLYLTALTRLSARRARRLIAVSKHAAAESGRLLCVSPERIDVIYHGVDPAFRPLPADEVAAFRQRRRLPERFAFFVGTLEPRRI